MVESWGSIIHALVLNAILNALSLSLLPSLTYELFTFSQEVWLLAPLLAHPTIHFSTNFGYRAKIGSRWESSSPT